MLDLERVGIYSCGTLRANRKGFPSDLKTAVKKCFKERGASQTRQCENLTVSVWQDNRPVTVIATNASPLEQCTVQRKTRDGTKLDIECPQSVVQYNKYMGGVDYNDQLRGYYGIRTKGRKFYKYIAMFLLDLTITNTFVLLKHYTHLNITDLKSFRMKLAKELIGSYKSRK